MANTNTNTNTNENKLGNPTFNLYNEKEQGVNSLDLDSLGYRMVGYYQWFTDGGRKVHYGETWKRG